VVRVIHQDWRNGGTVKPDAKKFQIQDANNLFNKIEAQIRDQMKNTRRK